MHNPSGPEPLFGAEMVGVLRDGGILAVIAV